MKAVVRDLLRTAGLDLSRARNTFRVHKDVILSLVEATERLKLDVVFDIGANAGQFGQQLRYSGFAGRIVSVEPLPEPHAALAKRAGADRLWTVADRAAVGDAVGTCDINVARNSVSSSLLPMLGSHLASAPNSAYVGSERVPLTTLEHLVAQHLADTRQSFALKIDTQGYEGRVLAGAGRSLPRVGALYLEMSLVPLYDGADSFADLYSLITRAGLSCIALAPAFTDPRTQQVLQVDALFVRFA